MNQYFVFNRGLYFCKPATFQNLDKDYELKHKFPNASYLYSTMEEALEEMKRLNHKEEEET